MVTKHAFSCKTSAFLTPCLAFHAIDSAEGVRRIGNISGAGAFAPALAFKELFARSAFSAMIAVRPVAFCAFWRTGLAEIVFLLVRAPGTGCHALRSD